MERIHYSGDDLLTGDDIALAVVHFAEALAKSDTSASIAIPTRRVDGSVGQAHLLLGPASELASENEESEFDEIVDQDLVRRLEKMTASLGAPRPHQLDAPLDTEDFEIAGMIEAVEEPER
jgi:hypothetical protein